MGVVLAAAGIAFALAMFPLRGHLHRDPLLAIDIGVALSLLFSPHVFGADLLLMGAVLIDLGRRNLAVAVVGPLVLNAAYVFETPLLHSSGHLEGDRAFVRHRDRRCHRLEAAGGRFARDRGSRNPFPRHAHRAEVSFSHPARATVLNKGRSLVVLHASDAIGVSEDRG